MTSQVPGVLDLGSAENSDAILSQILTPDKITQLGEKLGEKAKRDLLAVAQQEGFVLKFLRDGLGAKKYNEAQIVEAAAVLKDNVETLSRSIVTGEIGAKMPRIDLESSPLQVLKDCKDYIEASAAEVARGGYAEIVDGDDPRLEGMFNVLVAHFNGPDSENAEVVPASVYGEALEGTKAGDCDYHVAILQDKAGKFGEAGKVCATLNCFGLKAGANQDKLAFIGYVAKDSILCMARQTKVGKELERQFFEENSDFRWGVVEGTHESTGFHFSQGRKMAVVAKSDGTYEQVPYDQPFTSFNEDGTPASKAVPENLMISDKKNAKTMSTETLLEMVDKIYRAAYFINIESEDPKAIETAQAAIIQLHNDLKKWLESRGATEITFIDAKEFAEAQAGNKIKMANANPEGISDGTASSVQAALA